MQFFLYIRNGMANSADLDQTAPSLFASAILSDTLVYEMLGHLLYMICLLSIQWLSWWSVRFMASVAQLDAPSDWRPGGRGFNPRRGRQHSFVEIDHEMCSKVILSLPLIQEGQLSVSGERMCTLLVNRLED